MQIATLLLKVKAQLVVASRASKSTPSKSHNRKEYKATLRGVKQSY
jgi:hypothetical protein